MGILSGIIRALADPVAIVTGVMVGLILLTTRPGRIGTSLILLVVWLGTVLGVNFEIDVKNGAYVGYLENTNRIIHYMDDKPAKLHLSLARMAAALFWMGLVLYGSKARNYFRGP